MHVIVSPTSKFADFDTWMRQSTSTPKEVIATGGLKNGQVAPAVKACVDHAHQCRVPVTAADAEVASALGIPMTQYPGAALEENATQGVNSPLPPCSRCPPPAGISFAILSPC